MSTTQSLTPTQDQVLALISAGFTITAAAAQVGVHRNTVANWLHSDEFQTVLAEARYRKQLLYLDEAEALAARALARLTNLMDDPEVPAHVRLKATITVLDHARRFLSSDSASVVLPETTETVHKNAQEQTVAPPAPRQSPLVLGPKPGRNDLCPCGSGIKFKRCCLAKSHRPPENAAAA
jgi:hypothetical protein